MSNAHTTLVSLMIF